MTASASAGCHPAPPNDLLQLAEWQPLARIIGERQRGLRPRTPAGVLGAPRTPPYSQQVATRLVRLA